jgi:hypothetical protein
MIVAIVGLKDPQERSTEKWGSKKTNGGGLGKFATSPP